MAYRKDFFPDSEHEMVLWTMHFAQKISSSPETYGIPAERAAEYFALQQVFAEAYRVAVGPSTRTSGRIIAKNDARKAIERASRLLAKIVNTQPSVSNEQRVALGLKLANHRSSRIGRPTEAPSVSVLKVAGSSITVRLNDMSNHKRRGRPPGVQSAMVMVSVGEQPARTVGGWTYYLTGKTRYAIEIEEGVPAGSKVWISAKWLNQRNEGGPMAMAVHAYTQFEGFARLRPAA